ncbi:hypothetical protein RhiJN_13018 [Ceratobasidium sp. AG-Ba]|nr:hypothetical protein RhiJN_13018 [Ceratobasidium sp. AG-Ba]
MLALVDNCSRHSSSHSFPLWTGATATRQGTSSTLWPHYNPAQLPSPRTPSGSHSEPKTSPAMRGYVPPADYVAGAQYPSPGSSSAKSPHPGQPQLHALLKAQSILRTPESPAGFRLQWDVRDAPKEAVVLSSHEPEYLFEHPASVAYATSPPVPFMLIACTMRSLGSYPSTLSRDRPG